MKYMIKPKMTTVASFDVTYLQFLDEHYMLSQPFPEFADVATLLYFYRQMALIRKFDQKAVHLQRIGQLGTFPSSLGQEAVALGAGYALKEADLFVPMYRDQGIMLQRGVRLSELLSFWGGDERGSDYADPMPQSDFPICITIASQLLHAVGAAYALKYRKISGAVLVSVGDGGTSKGDFYEAINLAGVWHLPVVFLVINNQWAISVPRAAQTACQTLAQKSVAAGFSGYQVDGNDVIAVHYMVDQALQKARNGGGPTLIEALTYRLSDHTTADDAKRYVSPEALKVAWKHEPIKRLGYYLESQGLWSRDKEVQLQKELEVIVAEAVDHYLNQKAPEPVDMFDYLYKQLPVAYRTQRNDFSDN